MSKDPAIIEHYESTVLEKSGLCFLSLKQRNMSKDPAIIEHYESTVSEK